MSRGGRRPPSQPRPRSGCLLQARTWRPRRRARLKGGLRCGRGPLGLILGLGASARVSYWRLHAAKEQRGHRMPRPTVMRLLGVSGGGRPGERKEARETATATGLLRRSPPFAPWAAAHCPAGRSRGRADWTSPPPHPRPGRPPDSTALASPRFGGGVVYTPPGGSRVRIQARPWCADPGRPWVSGSV